MEVETRNDVVNKEGLGEEGEEFLQNEIATDAKHAEVEDGSDKIHSDPKQLPTEEEPEKALEIAQSKEPEKMDVSNLVQQFQELHQEIRKDIQENPIHQKEGESKFKNEVGKLEEGKAVNLIEVEKETSKALKGNPLFTGSMDQENGNGDKETATTTERATTKNEFRKLDKLLPKRQGRTEEDRGREVEGSLDWTRDNDVSPDDDVVIDNFGMLGSDFSLNQDS